MGIRFQIGCIRNLIMSQSIVMNRFTTQRTNFLLKLMKKLLQMWLKYGKVMVLLFIKDRK
jgi:hypothetical protein